MALAEPTEWRLCLGAGAASDDPPAASELGNLGTGSVALYFEPSTRRAVIALAAVVLPNLPDKVLTE